MTVKQITLYNKLRNRLRYRGIKNVPTARKVYELDNQKSFMLIKVLSEEIKNMNAWDSSPAFRQVCFNRCGPNFSMHQAVEQEIRNILEYCNTKKLI